MYRNLLAIAGGCLALVAVFLLAFDGRARGRADFAWINTTEPQTLDPQRTSAQPEGAIALCLFEGLTVYDPRDLKPVPGVARSVQVDGARYVFDLRDDAVWVKGDEVVRRVDGSPRRVTAEDFVWSWRRHLHPEVGSEYGGLLSMIRGAKAYAREVADHWSKTVDAVRAARGRAPATLSDLDPTAREEVERFRDERWRALAGIRAVGEGRLEVDLDIPAPYFLHITSFYPLLPVCREAVEAHGERWILPENMVTNGPYRLDEWRFNASIRMRRNRHYWESADHARRRIAELHSRSGLAEMERRELELLESLGSFGERGLETIEALAVEEVSTALNLYLTGGVDYVHQLPTELVRELIEESRRPGTAFRHLHHAPALTLYFYAVNSSLEVFSGEAGRKLRRALGLSIDRRAIVDRLVRGGQEPAFRFVPPGMEGYPARPILGSGDFEADAAEARRLVDEVRRERGKIPRLRVLYNSSESHEKIAAAIGSGWRDRLGIEVDLSNQEWGVFLDSRRSGSYEIARASWIADYPDPSTFLEAFTSTSEQNDTRWSSPLYDRIVLEACPRAGEVLGDAARRRDLFAAMEAAPCFPAIRERARAGGGTLWDALRAAAEGLEAAAEAERPARAAAARLLLLETAEEVLVHDLPGIPIFFYASVQLWPPELEGMHLNPSDFHPVKFLRWKGGRRPEGSRLGDFPRLSPRSRGQAPEGGGVK
jgi:oligopeptide transport system substrate-binding protein